MTALQTPSRRPVWAVIGGGNGGQSLAGHLALMGFGVRLYDIVPETVATIARQGGIRLSGLVQGMGAPVAATENIGEALEGADIVAVVAPATAHRAIARACAPFLQDGQLLFIHPGATGGALEFHQVLLAAGCRAAVTLAESNSLLYACRSPRPGEAHIFGIKKELMVAALPAKASDAAVDRLNTAFPQIYAGRNVLETSLGNPNAVMHPAPTLLNTSLIESGRPWLYYYDGITPSVGAFVEALDAERVALGTCFGLQLTPIRQWYAQAYNACGATLSEAVRNNPAYAGVAGQRTLETRYLLEDIPMGLVPMIALARTAGVSVTRMELIVRLAENLIDRDLTTDGRTLAQLGLAGMDVDRILRRVTTGS